MPGDSSSSPNIISGNYSSGLIQVIGTPNRWWKWSIPANLATVAFGYTIYSGGGGILYWVVDDSNTPVVYPGSNVIGGFTTYTKAQLLTYNPAGTGIIFQLQVPNGTEMDFGFTQTLDGGGGGEPHFVGFDNVHFDYHGSCGNWYVLWSSPGFVVEALFDLSLEAARYPTFGGTTFITALRVNGVECGLSGDWLDVVSGSVDSTGFVRGLPSGLQTVEGDVLGFRVFEHGDVRLVASLMSYKGEFKFINVGMSASGAASGILGQTLLPVSERVVLDSFKV